MKSIPDRIIMSDDWMPGTSRDVQNKVYATIRGTEQPIIRTLCNYFYDYTDITWDFSEIEKRVNYSGDKPLSFLAQIHIKEDIKKWLALRENA